MPVARLPMHRWSRRPAFTFKEPRVPGDCRGFVAKRRKVMGKYALGWLLGVPVVVLVIVYLIMN